MNRAPHPLGFKTEGLPLRQLLALVEALTTVGDVVSGLREQPRFAADDSAYNEAGSILEDLQGHIACEIDDICDEVERRPVSTNDEGEQKFGILIGRFTGGGDNPAGVISELASIAAGISADLRKAGAE